MHFGEAGFRFQRSLIARHGFVQLALTLENVAEVVVCLGVGGLQLQRSLITRRGFVRFALKGESITQVVVRKGEARPQS